MTEAVNITLKRVNALPTRTNTARSTRYDELIMSFLHSDWNAARFDNLKATRPGNARSHIQSRIKALGLNGVLTANVRAGKIYISRVENKSKRKPVIIEAGVGVKQGSVLESEVSA